MVSSKMSPNLREIAARAGVSHTTVSLALRGDLRLPVRTRQRIEKIAQRLGYQRDATLGELMARLRTIRARPAHAALGFITAWSTRHGWSEAPNHRRFYAGALDRAQQDRKSTRLNSSHVSESRMASSA